jgi:hypothetical protein
MFGLKLSDRFDGTYYSLLILSIGFFTIVVGILSNLNYDELHQRNERIIRSRYKALVAQLIVDQPSPKTSTIKIIEPYTASPVKRQKAVQKAINKQVDKIIQAGKKESAASSGLANTLDELPDVEDFVDNMDQIESHQLTAGRSNWPGGVSKAKSSDGVTNFDAGSVDSYLARPFNYNLTRRGVLLIDLTDELKNEPKKQSGYRDPKEIERVVGEHQQMIEYCYRKELKRNIKLKGFVKVEFQISYEGFVIPSSIRILNSTLRNLKVEQCIKTYIRRWNSFARLDESMGIARVVQKFIFN